MTINKSPDNSKTDADSQASIPDSDLLRRCRDGNEDAATTLYERYAVRLQRLAEKQTDTKMASRIDPEGIVQSVFRTFFRRVSKGQYDVAEENDLWNLLLVISLNKLRKEATRQRTAKRDINRTLPIRSDESPKRATGDQEALLVLKMTVEEILADMGDSQRKIIELRIAGCDINSIADQTGRAKRSIERILQQFRQRLSEVIDGE